MKRKQFIGLLFFIIIKSVFSNQELKPKLFYSCNDYLVRQVTFDNNNNIYFCCGDTCLYSVSLEGQLLWKTKVGTDGLYCSPTIGNDGSIYISSMDYHLYAYTSQGTLKWIFKTDYILLGNPAIGHDGTIYLTSADWYLYAINPNGSLKWKKKYYCSFSTSPVIGPDGTIYISSRAGWLYAITPSGNTKWSFKTDGCIKSTPTINKKGIIFVKSEEGRVQALNYPSVSFADDDNKFWFYIIKPDGKLVHKYELNGGGSSSPVTIKNGHAYAATDSSHLYCFADFGRSRLHDRRIQKKFHGSPIIYNDDIIVIPQNDTTLVAKNRRREYWRCYLPSKIMTTPVLNKNMIYIGTSDKNIYTIELPDSNHYNKHYSKFGIDNRNTFNTYDPNCPIAELKLDSINVKPGEPFTLEAKNLNNRKINNLNFQWTINSIPNRANISIERINELKYKFTTDKHQYGLYKIGFKVSTKDSIASADVIHVLSGIKWMRYLNRRYESSPSIYGNTLYFGEGSYSIYSYNKNGKSNWFYNCRAEIETRPAVSKNQNIYFIANRSNDTFICAIDNTGKLKWKYDIDYHRGSSYSFADLAIDNDENIYASQSSKVFAFTSSGELKWTLELPNDITSIDISINNKIFLQSKQRLSGRKKPHCFHVLNKNGELIRTIYTNDNFCTKPAYDIDGNIYIGSYNTNTFYSIKSTGEINWIFNPSNPIIYNPVINSEGNIIFSTRDHTIYALNPKGQTNWIYKCDDKITSSMTIGKDGAIYIGNEKGKMITLTSDGKLKDTYHLEGNIKDAPSIMDDGTIYVFTENGYFYALNSDSKGIAKDIWPKYRRNNRNSGNLFDTE